VGTIVHYDGSSWKSQTSSSTDNLVGVWGSSPQDVFAVGRSSVLHYDGSQWSHQRLDLREPTASTYECPTLKDIDGTAAGSELHVLVVGENQTVLRYCPAGQCP
jgi:hypothetical protein